MITIEVYPHNIGRPEAFKIDEPTEVCLAGKFSQQTVKLSKGIWIAAEYPTDSVKGPRWFIDTKRIGT